MEAQLNNWLTTLSARYESYRKPAHLLSMTTRQELCFCESYARDCFSGEGRMVDLGCWYGATTYCLAQGLTQNTRAKRNRIIEAFDLFVWEHWMDPVAEQSKEPIRYQAGQSFLHDVQNVLAPYRDVVRLHQQDLTKFQPPEEPIELLFVDAMKTWPLAQNIATSFYPRLIPGLSVVVQQDFACHAPISATNHLTMWRLRDYFDSVHHVPRSGSVAFVNKKQIPQASLPDLSVESFTLDDINQAYDYSLNCVPHDPGRSWIKAAKLLFLIERGYYEAALIQAERLVGSRAKFGEHIIADTHRIIGAHRSPARSNKPALPCRTRRADKLEILARIETMLPALTAKPPAGIGRKISDRWLGAIKSRSLCPWVPSRRSQRSKK